MQESLFQDNLIPIQCTLYKDNYEDLVRISKETGLSVSNLVTFFIIEGIGRANKPKKAPKALKKTHYRLEQYLEAYEKKKGLKYVIGDYNSHCGAAARTVSKVSDSEWLKIIDLYLDSTQERVKQAGHPFHWLIHDLNRWFRESNAQKSVGWAQKLKDIIKGK